MLSSKYSERVLYCFYLLGLSAFNPRESAAFGRSTLSRTSLPSVCFLLVILFSFFMTFDLWAKSKINWYDYLHAVNVISTAMTSIMAFKRSSFLRGDTNYLWKYLINLEKLVVYRLKMNIKFNKFIGLYMIKLICMVFVFTCVIVNNFLQPFYAGRVVRQVGSLALLLTTLGAIFHILFYVDLFNFVFETINQDTLKCAGGKIVDISIVDVKDKNGGEILQMYKMLKLIHFKLWKIVKLMNSDFSSVLTLFIIQNTNMAIQSFYWIIIEIFKEDLFQNTQIISMYSGCYGKIIDFLAFV